MMFSKLITLLFVINITSVGGHIQILTDQKEAECGRNITLTCKTDTNPSILAWINENDVIPISQCSRNTCSLNPEYDKKYRISFEIREGVFNLTKISVTMNDDGRKLTCSNGSNSVSIMVAVRDYQVDLRELPEIGVINATSGCISRDVLFKWTKIDVDTKQESVFLPMSHTERHKDCTDDFICGKNGQVQRSDVIHAKAHDNGKYYLKISMVYGNETIISQTTSSKYMLEEEDNRYKDAVKRDNIHVYIIYIVFLLLLLLFLLLPPPPPPHHNQ